MSNITNYDVSDGAVVVNKNVPDTPLHYDGHAFHADEKMFTVFSSLAEAHKCIRGKELIACRMVNGGYEAESGD